MKHLPFILGGVAALCVTCAGATPSAAEANLEVLALRSKARADQVKADEQRDRDREKLLTDEAKADAAAEKESRAKSVEEGARADDDAARSHEASARAATIRDEMRLVQQRIDTLKGECNRGKDFLRTLYAKRAGDETRLRDRAFEMGREKKVAAMIDAGAMDHHGEAAVRIMARPHPGGVSADVLVSGSVNNDGDDGDDGDDVYNNDDADEDDEGDLDNVDEDDDEEDGLGDSPDVDLLESDEGDADGDDDGDDDDDESARDLLVSVPAPAGVGPNNEELSAERRLEIAQARRQAIIRARELERIIAALHATIKADRERELTEEKQIELCVRRVEEAKTRLAVLKSDLADATRTAAAADADRIVSTRAAAKDKLNADNARDKAAALREESARVEREEMSLDVEAHRDENEAKALEDRARRIGAQDKEDEVAEEERAAKRRREMQEEARRMEELDKKIVFPKA